MSRKVLLFPFFSLLLGEETPYFGREHAATVLRQWGERTLPEVSPKKKALATDPRPCDARFPIIPFGPRDYHEAPREFRTATACLVPGTSR